MRNDVLRNLKEAKDILRFHNDPRAKIDEINRNLKNLNPNSNEYICKAEDRKIPVINGEDILFAVGKAVLISAIATLVVRILLALVLGVIYVIGMGLYPTTHEKHDMIKDAVYKIPMWISDKLLEGRRGLFTSEPTFLEKSLLGLLITFLAIGFICVIIYVFMKIKDSQRINGYKDDQINEEKQKIFEQKEEFRRNPGSYEAYCQNVKDKLQKDIEWYQKRTKELNKLLDEANCPNQYRNIQAINMFIDYIENGRAYDIVGAINQINYDSNQRQLLAETQATRAAYERAARASQDAARASQDAARAAQNAADATSQANQDAWFRYYNKR